MVVIKIPVKKHIKKYLQTRYGVVHKISKKSLIGLFLLELLDKKVEKPEREVSKEDFYEIEIPEFYFNTKGYTVDRNKIKLLALSLERMFMEDFYAYVDNNLKLGSGNALHHVRTFLKLYAITEDELKQDSMYRNYQRYSNENITQKKQVNIKK